MKDETNNYQGGCHCGAIRFSFSSPEIKTGIKCNCSICLKKTFLSALWYISLSPNDA